MPRLKSDEERLAGKLISAIQKIWGDQAGEPELETTERKMSLGHYLLQARNADKMQEVLGGLTVMQFLDEDWLEKYPAIKPIASKLNQSIYNENA